MSMHRDWWMEEHQIYVLLARAVEDVRVGAMDMTSVFLPEPEASDFLRED